MIKKYKKILMILMSLVLIMVEMIGCSNTNKESKEGLIDSRGNAVTFVAMYYNTVEDLNQVVTQDHNIFSIEVINKERIILEYMKSMKKICPKDLEQDFNKLTEYNEKYLDSCDKFNLDDVEDYNSKFLEKLKSTTKKVIDIKESYGMTNDELDIEQEKNPIKY